jgi:tRNA threonylcarbamoyladenosine biosynthesis protein TsaE
MMEKSKDVTKRVESHVLRTRSPQETMDAAGDILTNAWPKRGRGALVLALLGPLGSGKTQFAKGAASFLGVERTIASPTFILMKRYELPRSNPLPSARALYHIDCYRVRTAKEVSLLGWDVLSADTHNIVLVEWAENIVELLPATTTRVSFVGYNEDERELSISP